MDEKIKNLIDLMVDETLDFFVVAFKFMLPDTLILQIIVGLLFFTVLAVFGFRKYF